MESKSVIVLGNQFEFPQESISYIGNYSEESLLFVADNVLFDLLLYKCVPLSCVLIFCVIMLTTRDGWRRTLREIIALYFNGVNDINGDNEGSSNYKKRSDTYYNICQKQFFRVQIQAILFLLFVGFICFFCSGLLSVLSSPFYQCSPLWMKITVSSLSLTEPLGWLLACFYSVFLLLVLLYLIKYSTRMYEMTTEKSNQINSDSNAENNLPSPKLRYIRILCGLVLTGICVLFMCFFVTFYFLLQNLPLDNSMLNNHSFYIFKTIYVQDLVLVLIPPVISLLNLCFTDYILLYIIQNIEKVDRIKQPFSHFSRLFIIRLFSSLLAPIAIVCFVDMGCANGYLMFWNPCNHDNHQFDILDSNEPDLSTPLYIVKSADVCQMEFQYGYCSRRVIQLCGLLQFKIFLYHASFKFVAVLLWNNCMARHAWNRVKEKFRSFSECCKGKSHCSSAMTIDGETLRFPLLDNPSEYIDDVRETSLTRTCVQTSAIDSTNTNNLLPQKVEFLSMSPLYVNFIIDVAATIQYAFFYPFILFPALLYFISSLFISVYVQVSNQTRMIVKASVADVWLSLEPTNITKEDSITPMDGHFNDVTNDPIKTHEKDCSNQGSDSSFKNESKYFCSSSPNLPYASSYGLLLDKSNETFLYNFLPNPTYLFIALAPLPILGILFYIENDISGKWLVVGSSVAFFVSGCLWHVRYSRSYVSV